MRVQERTFVARAIQILEIELRNKPATVLDSIQLMADYARLYFGLLEEEHFGCMFLTSQGALIAYETLFKGTLDHCAVYPRQIARRALQNNAASVVLVHNHPSGHAFPSQADVDLTEVLVKTLQLVDVALADHLIVCGLNVHSMNDQKNY